jgi:hypothetical protein
MPRCGVEGLTFRMPVVKYVGPERALQTPRCARGQGAQCRMKLPYREAPPVGGELHICHRG